MFSSTASVSPFGWSLGLPASSQVALVANYWPGYLTCQPIHWNKMLGFTCSTSWPSIARSSPTMTRSSAQLQPPTGSCFHPGWNGRSQTSWSCSKLTFSVEPRSSPSTPSLDRYNLFSLIFKPFELTNNQVYAGWGGEGGIAFALLTRQPRVRIPAPPFLLTA